MLGDHEDAGGRAGTEYRARTKRQMRFAGATVSYGCQQCLKRAVDCFGHHGLLG